MVRVLRWSNSSVVSFILISCAFQFLTIASLNAQDSIFPMVITPPQPPPPPPPVDPKGILTLTSDRVYVAKSNKPFFLIASPNDTVSIQIVNGPIAIYGLFADTPNKVTPELRTFTEPNVRIVTPKKTGGQVELIAVIEGIKSIDELQRVTLQLGPIPPPVPPTPPTPPGPTPPTPVTEFRALFIYDMVKSYPAPIMQAMNSKAIRAYLTAKTTKENGIPEWRFWDIDAEFSSRATVPLVAMFTELRPKLSPDAVRQNPFIMIRKNGKSELIPLPDTEEKTLTLLKSYAGE